MEFINETKLVANWTFGFDPSGRELLVVVAKGTFVLPPDSSEPTLADEQVALTEADAFSGPPGLSAPTYESDFAHFKPVCDVLVNATARVPEGRPTSSLVVGVRVGTLSKSFEVVGPRTYSASRVTGVFSSPPAPFTEAVISYEVAFGGLDASTPGQTLTYTRNPVGRGFGRHPRAIDAKPLPLTQAIGDPVLRPDGDYTPMALGPIGRSWEPRWRLAGTYDDEWLDQHAPFWPADFDYRYFQAAPVDQQMPYPVGGEDIVLVNLGAPGTRHARVPKHNVPVLLIDHSGDYVEQPAVIDTVLIEADLERLCLTWRLCHPLRRNVFELREVVVGGRSAAWKAERRARLSGRKYYRSLAELINERRGVRR